MVDLSELQALTGKRERIWQLISVLSVAALGILLITRMTFQFDYRYIFGIALIIAALIYLKYNIEQKKIVSIAHIILNCRNDWAEITGKYLDDSTGVEAHPLSSNEWLVYFAQNGMVFWWNLMDGIRGWRKDELQAVLHDIETSKLATKLVEKSQSREATKAQLAELGFSV